MTHHAKGGSQDPQALLRTKLPKLDPGPADLSLSLDFKILDCYN